MISFFIGLVPEVTGAGKDHGQAMFVGGGDDFFVAHRTARLDDGLGTGFGQHVDAIAEREEGIRGDDRTGQVRPACWALMLAILVESTRLIWPAPTPSVMPLPQKTMALDLTNLATRSAKSRSSICWAVGWTLVTIFRPDACAVKLSAVWTSRPPPTRLNSSCVQHVRDRHDEDAQVLLGRQRGLGFGGEGRGDQHFDEVLALAHRIDHVDADFAVEGDDAAEG
jgi:hypothetical protein